MTSPDLVRLAPLLKSEVDSRRWDSRPGDVVQELAAPVIGEIAAEHGIVLTRAHDRAGVARGDVLRTHRTRVSSSTAKLLPVRRRPDDNSKPDPTRASSAPSAGERRGTWRPRVRRHEASLRPIHGLDAHRRGHRNRRDRRAHHHRAGGTLERTFRARTPVHRSDDDQPAGRVPCPTGVRRARRAGDQLRVHDRNDSNDVRRRAPPAVGVVREGGDVHGCRLHRRDRSRVSSRSCLVRASCQPSMRMCR